ncbi:MAG: HisS family protein [Chloroflexota bacterium]
MRDMLPADMALFRHVEGVFRDCCLKWGYREVKTPTVEYMHLFTSTGTLTPGMLGKVYSFLDWDGWSGERVVLRPDCTIPVARLYIESSQGRSSPAKLFYVTNVFAFEETGRESRERWQCGAEFLGGRAPGTDAELVALALEVARLLGLYGAEVRLSHVGVLRALLRQLALTEEEESEVLDRVLDGNVEALSRLSSQKSELGGALSLLLGQSGGSRGSLKNLRSLCGAGMKELARELDDFVALVDVLEAVGCPYRVDMGSARGFEYYTGATFQFMCRGRRIGAGGRYDALVPMMGGGDVSACGFALYLDCLMPLLQAGVGQVPSWKGIYITLAGDPASLKAAFGVARVLREAGFVADVDLSGGGKTGWDWRLDVQPSSFTLKNSKGESFSVASVAELLRLLEAR